MTNYSGTILEANLRKAVGFDVNTIWQMAFGYTGLPFPANVLNSNVPGLSGPLNAANKKYLTSTRTGGYFYEEVNGRLSFMPVRINGVLFPIARLGVGRRKVIEKTPMTGKNGTVKELIRSNDWEITIQGLAFGQDRIYPEDEIAALQEIEALKESVKINCVITDFFLNDEYVVVERFDLPPSRSEHVQPWSLKLISDEIFDLYID